MNTVLFVNATIGFSKKYYCYYYYFPAPHRPSATNRPGARARSPAGGPPTPCRPVPRAGLGCGPGPTLAAPLHIVVIVVVVVVCQLAISSPSKHETISVVFPDEIQMS